MHCETFVSTHFHSHLLLVIGTQQAAQLTTVTDTDGQLLIRRLVPGAHPAFNQPTNERPLTAPLITDLRLYESGRELTNRDAEERAGESLDTLMAEVANHNFNLNTLPRPRDLVELANEAYSKAIMAKWMTLANAVAEDVGWSTKPPTLLLKGYWEFTGLIWAHYHSDAARCQECGGPREIWGRALACCAHYREAWYRADYAMHIGNVAALQICPKFCGHQLFERGLELVGHCLVFHGTEVPGMPSLRFILGLLRNNEEGKNLFHVFYIQTCVAQALNNRLVLDVSGAVGGVFGRGRGVYDEAIRRQWDGGVEEDRFDEYAVMTLRDHKTPGTTIRHFEGRELLVSVDSEQARAVISINTTFFRADPHYRLAIYNMLGGFVYSRDGHPLWKLVLPPLAAIVESEDHLNFHVLRAGTSLAELLLVDQANVIKVLLQGVKKGVRALAFILRRGYWVQDLSLEKLHMKHRNDTNFARYCTIIAKAIVPVGSAWQGRSPNRFMGSLEFCNRVHLLAPHQLEGLMVRALFVQLLTGLLDSLPRNFCMSQYCTEQDPITARANPDMVALFCHPGMEAQFDRLPFFGQAR